VTPVDYDRRLYQAYRAGRRLSADAGRLWMDALARHAGRARPDRIVLDLGAGTGRFSVLLAETFQARVVAVEPSAKMRADAERGSAHPRVVYRDGTADAVPAADGEFDFALLSMVIHHVPDLDGCARELRRVVRRGGLVFIRNTFSGRLDGIRHYEFFPSARAIDEARLPSVERVREAFEARGFATVALDTIEQEIDPSLAAHYDRIEHRALSSLELVSDSEFERGLALMRVAVDREAAPIPVREKVDLLVLHRSRDESPR
jgi:ubiquinone/menaquinone biosynthesis C-methylase UbiE